MWRNTMRDRVSKGLEDIGACWAVRSDKYTSPDDGYDSKPTWHIHPDASYPHNNSIIRFSSLKEILNWITACKEAARTGGMIVYIGDGAWEVQENY